MYKLNPLLKDSNSYVWRSLGSSHWWLLNCRCFKPIYDESFSNLIHRMALIYSQTLSQLILGDNAVVVIGQWSHDVIRSRFCPLFGVKGLKEHRLCLCQISFHRVEILKLSNHWQADVINSRSGALHTIFHGRRNQIISLHVVMNNLNITSGNKR